jgi:hypothetical protein
MEAICSTETSFDFQRTTRRCIPEDTDRGYRLFTFPLYSYNENHISPGLESKVIINLKLYLIFYIEKKLATGA